MRKDNKINRIISLFLLGVFLCLAPWCSAQTVDWLEGEVPVPNYNDLDSAYSSGHVEVKEDYVQVGSLRPGGGFPASYRQTFKIDTAYTMLVIHLIMHTDGHGSGGAECQWSIPAFDVGMYLQIDSETNKECIRYIDLSQYDGDTFTFYAYADDCSPVVHAANVRFALGYMSKNRYETFYCPGDTSVCLQIPQYPGATYRWYQYEYPKHTISTDNTVCIPISNDITYRCDITQEDIAVPIIYDIIPTVDQCVDFHQFDTIILYDSIRWRDHVIYEAGDYHDTLQNICHCDSIYSLHVPEWPVHRSEEYDTICEGEIYIWNGEGYDRGGTYSIWSVAQDGLDSLAVLYLYSYPRYDIFAKDSLNPESWDDPYYEPRAPKREASQRRLTHENESDMPDLNDPESWHDPYSDSIGHVIPDIHDPESWNDPYPESSGRPIPDLHDPEAWEDPYMLEYLVFDTICTGEPYHWRGHVYTEGGLYGDTLQTIHGCDSIFYLQLTDTFCCDSLPIITDTTILYGETITWFGNEYSNPGVYYDTIFSEDCDSLGQLILHVLYSDTLLTCGDESVTFVTPFGSWESGDCDTLIGCLSMLEDGTCLVEGELYVQRLYPDSVSEDTTVCAGMPVLWHGLTLMDEGVYYDTIRYTTEGACDSLYCRLTIHHTSPIETDTTDYICFGADYEWHGQMVIDVTEDLTLIDVLSTVDGCDSVVTLTLHVSPQPITRMEQQTICEGTSYTWHTYRDSVVSAPGLYEDTLWTEQGCIKETYTLILSHKFPSTGDTTAYVCYGDLPYLWYGKTLTEACDTSWTTTNSAGCDSIVTLHLFVSSQPKTEHQDSTICHGDMIDWHNQTINTDGIYYDTARVTMGNGMLCDSIWYELSVATQKSDTTKNNISICAGNSYTWQRNGKPDRIISEAGEYWDTVRYVQTGCDSMIYYLNLQVDDITRDSTSATTCAGTPYLWRGNSLEVADVYRDTAKAQTATECDTIYTLLLIINQPTTGDTTATACDSFTWHGATYTESTNEPQWTTTNAAGCDSIVTLKLTIYKSGTGEETKTICDKQLPYTWKDKTCTAAGDYTFDTLTVHGCDSTITLHLIVNDHSEQDTTAYVCYEDMPFIWHNKEAQDGDTIKLTNSAGCDSIVTLHLFVSSQPKTEHQDSTICHGDMIDWHNQTINTDGIYYDTARVTMGNGMLCDSIWYELSVATQKSDTTKNNISICAGNSYTWQRNGKPDRIISEAGEYWDTVRYVQTGCDSMIYYLNLQVDDITRDSTSATTCAGTPYLWRGNSLEVADVYRDTAKAQTATECDTIYTLLLIINQPSTGDTTSYVCYEDMPFIWHNKEAQDGDTIKLTNSAGCDSIVTLHLFVSSQPKTEHQDSTICHGDMIDWHNQTINTDGIYYDTARVTMGNGMLCDSIWYELSVATQKSDTTKNNISICAGNSYTWQRNGKPDRIISEAGEYWDTVRYVQTGCDSMIYYLNLQVDDITRDSTSATTCAGTPYLWRGSSLEVADVYRDTAKAQTATECDTIYTLLLIINQPTTGDTTATACDSFTWHGATYTESTNEPQWTTTNAAGCDSIVTLKLTIYKSGTGEETKTICDKQLPYTWKDKTCTAAGDYTFDTLTVHGCDSTITLHLIVNDCCPDTTMQRMELSICDTLMPYTWTTWRTNIINQVGPYADTLRNESGCDSIIYTLNLDTFHCCAPLKAAIDVPDYICADAPSLPIDVKLISGECVSYSLHFTNPTRNKMPFRDTTIMIDTQYASEDTWTLDIPVPNDPNDSTHYVRPDDNYKVSLTLNDGCGNSVSFGDSIFSVYYPSWIMDQHWDDVIALLNDRYNGGYTFSNVEWLRDGDKLLGESNYYIYLPHELWTNPYHQHQSYFYQALLTRTDDGKTLPTCPLEPWHIDNTNVLTDPYVSVTPTLVPIENPVVHVMTNTEGTYWVYDPTGKLLQTADYEPCEHNVFDIQLRYHVQTMYILVFTPRNEKNPLQKKYSVVKVLVE